MSRLDVDSMSTLLCLYVDSIRLYSTLFDSNRHYFDYFSIIFRLCSALLALEDIDDLYEQLGEGTPRDTIGFVKAYMCMPEDVRTGYLVEKPIRFDFLKEFFPKDPHVCMAVLLDNRVQLSGLSAGQLVQAFSAVTRAGAASHIINPTMRRFRAKSKHNKLMPSCVPI